MNHINHVLFLILKTCQDPNPRDVQLRDIFFLVRHPPHKRKKIDATFKI